MLQKSPKYRGPRKITWLLVCRRNHLLYHFSLGTISPPRQFLRDKLVLKNKLAKGNFFFKFQVYFIGLLKTKKQL